MSAVLEGPILGSLDINLVPTSRTVAVVLEIFRVRERVDGVAFGVEGDRGTPIADIAGRADGLYGNRVSGCFGEVREGVRIRGDRDRGLIRAIVHFDIP